MFNSPERFGDCADGREESLRRYIARQVRNAEEFRTSLERAPGAKNRFNLRCRSGGPRHRAWMETNNAIARELDRRAESQLTQEKSHPIPAHSSQMADAQQPYRARALVVDSRNDGLLYPAKYAVDVNHIERKTVEDEMRLREPTRKETLTAAIVNAQNRGDFVSARRTRDQLDSIRAHERVVARAKRFRKRQIHKCHDEMDRPGYNPEPNSDDGGGAPCA